MTQERTRVARLRRIQRALRVAVPQLEQIDLWRDARGTPHLYVGGEPGTVYGKHGKPFLKERIGGCNNASRHAPWVVLVDLDTDADCAPPFRATWLPHPAPHMCFRVAVRAVEAWLMADAETLARFLSVAQKKVSADPVAPSARDSTPG